MRDVAACGLVYNQDTSRSLIVQEERAQKSYFFKREYLPIEVADPIRDSEGTT